MGEVGARLIFFTMVSGVAVLFDGHQREIDAAG
jgi:hypothetical protein